MPIHSAVEVLQNIKAIYIYIYTYITQEPGLADQYWEQQGVRYRPSHRLAGG